MPLAGFEPTIPVFKRAKTFHALDRAATVTGSQGNLSYNKADVIFQDTNRTCLAIDISMSSDKN
jgi:hypothetical protein